MVTDRAADFVLTLPDASVAVARIEWTPDTSGVAWIVQSPPPSALAEPISVARS
jgi:hypothetical protein